MNSILDGTEKVSAKTGKTASKNTILIQWLQGIPIVSHGISAKMSQSGCICPSFVLFGNQKEQ